MFFKKTARDIAVLLAALYKLIILTDSASGAYLVCSV